MTHVSPHISDCHICSHFARLSPAQTIWRDDSWIASSVFDVPGWTMVATLRHAAGCWDLTDAEAAGFGLVMRALSAAIKIVTGAERVHMLAQGEFALHFHYLLIPRLPAEQPVFDGALLIERAKTIEDPVTALASARRIAGLASNQAPHKPRQQEQVPTGNPGNDE